jgi:hypothetical protein
MESMIPRIGQLPAVCAPWRLLARLRMWSFAVTSDAEWAFPGRVPGEVRAVNDHCQTQLGAILGGLRIVHSPLKRMEFGQLSEIPCVGGYYGDA